MEMDWSKHGQTNFRLARGLWQKNFPLRNDLPNLEKKNRFVILFLVCWFLLQREKQVRCWFLPEELLFLQKKSPRRTISKPQNDFSFQRKADRFCFFFFRHQRKNYESGKIVLLYYFLTMLWIISNSALPFTVSLNLLMFLMLLLRLRVGRWLWRLTWIWMGIKSSIPIWRIILCWLEDLEERLEMT